MRYLGSAVLAGCLVSLSSVVLGADPAFLNSNDIDNLIPELNLPPEGAISGPALQAPSQPVGTLSLDSLVPLRGVQLQGGTVYPFEEVAALFQPLIGKQVAIRDLLAVTEQISQRYRDDGYALSYAYLPEQNLTDGQIRVVLVEGYIAAYQVRGELGPAQERVRQLAAKLVNERPLTRRSFERYSTLLAQTPGAPVLARVAPPTTTDGATVMVLEGKRKPFDLSAGFDTDNEDSAQVFLTGTARSLTSWGDSLSLSTLLPPGEDDERYLGGQYSQYLGLEGTRLALSASRYRSEPHDLVNVAGLATESERDNQRYGLALSHPFLLSPKGTLTGSLRAYAVNDTREYYQAVPGGAQVASIDSRIRVLAAEANWQQKSVRQQRVISAGAYQGFDAMGAESRVRVNGVGEAELHDLDFTRLRLTAVQSNRFAERWQGVLSGAAYWSADTLPDSEQALFGGDNFGRGYPDDQASGDKGWGLGYELNYSHRRDGTWLKLLQPYAYVDTARAWTNEGSGRARMSSAALGLRFSDQRFYRIGLEAARPLSDRAVDTGERSMRYTLSFSYWL